MRSILRTAAATLAAAVVLPVLPAVVAAPVVAAAHAAPKASSAPTLDWLRRDAKAKATVAHLARRQATAALRAYRSAAPGDREALRAAAVWAARNAKAKATIAHLAQRKVQAATPAVRKRASRGGDRTPLGVWDRLAQCESGGNWSINTGNGYYGGLQFSLGSWRAVGGGGYPHNASLDEQILRGEPRKEPQGWGAWSACSRTLGLR